MAATVMVVEDDVCIRELVVEILGGEGFTAVGARNGVEALWHLRQEHLRPALILLDLMMPVMNGWQFRIEQLGDPSLAGIPVVVMSASDQTGVPAVGHVSKPFDIEVLLDTVSRFTASGSTLHQPSCAPGRPEPDRSLTARRRPPASSAAFARSSP